MKKYRILIVEDIPIICQFYEGELQKLAEKNLRFVVDVAHTFDMASHKLKIATPTHYDLVLLDIRLRDIKKRKTHDGETLGKKIRQLMPEAKIMVITAYDNGFRFHTIFKSINPEGFVMKHELTDNELTRAIELLLQNKSYYSDSITRYLNQQVTTPFKIDDLDRKLLYLLSNCLTTKEISKRLPLSESGIEKRKRNLGKVFHLENAKTPTLIQMAKKHGYLD